MARWTLDIVFGSNGQQGPVTAWGFSTLDETTKKWVGSEWWETGFKAPSVSTTNPPAFKLSDVFWLNICDTDHTQNNVTELANVIVAFTRKDNTGSSQSPFPQSDITWFAASDSKDVDVHASSWVTPWASYTGGAWVIGARKPPVPDKYVFKNEGNFECIVFITVKLSNGVKKVFWVDPEMDVAGPESQ